MKRANLFADAVGVDRGDVDGCARGVGRTSAACDDRRGQRHNAGFHIFLPDILFTQRDIDRNLQCGCQHDHSHIGTTEMWRWSVASIVG